MSIEHGSPVIEDDGLVQSPEEGYLEIVAEEPQEMPLAEIASRPFVDLKELSLEDLQHYESTLVDAMVRNGHSARTFLRVAETFPAPLQKKLRNPEVVREQTLNYIVTLRQHCHERFAKEQQLFEAQQRAQQRAAEEELVRKRVEEIQLREAVERQAAQEILSESNRYAEEQFEVWNLHRQPRDAYGKIRELLPDDQAVVDQIEARRRQQVESGRSFVEVSDRLEYSFAQWLKDFDILGEGMTTMAGPVSKYDDIMRHVDVAVHHQIPGVRKGIGIDFTVNGNDVDLARKLQNTFDHPITRIKYGTALFQPSEELIKLVISLDASRAKRVMEAMNFEHVADPTNPIHQKMSTSFQQSLNRHHDREILQYTVVEEMLEQVKYQLEMMNEKEVDPSFTADHVALVAHLEGVLQERNSLRDVATTEAEKEPVRSVYRSREQEFIRSVVAA